MSKNQHVVKTDDGWGVKGTGNSRLTSEHKTQQKAINAAISIAKHQKTEVIVHDRDGRIRERDSYSIAADSCPPRDIKTKGRNSCGTEHCPPKGKKR